jgi:hypothetical protein
MSSKNLKEAIIDMVNKKFSENKMLVWYDEGGTLDPIIDQIVPEDAELVKYEGSYLQIRAEIEKEGNLEKKHLIYIPRKPLKQSWIRDYELFGEKIEMSLPRILQEDFGLKTKPELATVLTPANCRRLAGKWDEVVGQVEPPLSQEKLEEGLLAALLDQPSKFDVKKAALAFLRYPEDVEGRLEKSGLKQIFLSLLHKNGLPPMDDLDPKRLAATLLLSELISNSEGVKEKGLENVLAERNSRKFWSDAVHEWAANATLVESFFQWSEKVEMEYGIKEKITGVRKIEDVESFKAVDYALLEEIQTRVAHKGVKGILENADFIEKITKTRENRVWTREGEIKEWGVLRRALQLLKGIEVSLKKITSRDITLTEAYCDKWWSIDQTYRELATLEKEVEHSVRSTFIKPVARRYQIWLEQANKAFTEDVAALGAWPLPGAPSQDSFWKEFVKPQSKICVFLLDALRFELQKRLLEMLKRKGHKVKHTILLSSLPSITEVCMTSLLPHEKIGLELSNEDLVVALNGEEIRTKEDRINLLRKVYGDEIAFLKLDQLKQDPQSLMKEVEGARIAIVMDREIDRAGTFISGDLLDYMDALLEKILIGVETAALIGYPKIIITTDHGFLIIPEPDGVKTIRDFSGKGLSVSRRYAVGRPPKVEGCFTIPLSKAGYASEGEILFPLGISYLPKGGSKEIYIHGGVSLQECCIGILEVEPQGLGERVKVRTELSEPITTQIFRVKLIPVSTHLLPIPRKVKMELWSKGELVGEQKPIELSREPREIWLKLQKTPKTVEVRVRDADTDEIIHTKIVSVALEGYDELI